MERKDIIRDVLQAADEFNSRKLWKRFTNSDCLGVRIAGEDELMLGVVLEGAGEEYGVSLFRGPSAASCLIALLDSEGFGDDALDDMDMLGFTMEVFGNLLPQTQAALRGAGQHPRYDEQVPHFMAKAPRHRPGFPDESELRLLLLVLPGVVEADKKKLLRPTRLDDKGGVCVLNISGETAAPQVTVTQEHEKQGVLDAFMAWAIMDYHPNKSSQTQAEKMLEKDLPRVEAILLRARMEACPTLYRVAGHRSKAGTIDLEDVPLGGSVTVHDQLMSENIEDNVFFAARAFPAGGFHFVDLAGPPLGPGMGLEAVEFLRSSGMEFTSSSTGQEGRSALQRVGSLLPALPAPYTPSFQRAFTPNPTDTRRSDAPLTSATRNHCQVTPTAA